jgi:AraC-like DNA-binding protein
MIVVVHKGKLYLDRVDKPAVTGNCIFLPAGKRLRVCFGKNEPSTYQFKDAFSLHSKHIKEVQELNKEKGIVIISLISFDVRVYDTVHFFASIDLPHLIIHSDRDLLTSLEEIVEEKIEARPGWQRIQPVLTELMMIRLIRHMQYVEPFNTLIRANATFFKDPRLIDLFAYVKENLSGDLSNKVLADVANVSEDYVGQFFKTMTGTNPQDFIENRRMEMAIHLLKTSKLSIRDLSKKVGYKDTAYFCRRFKMTFGMTTGKMRRNAQALSASI